MSPARGLIETPQSGRPAARISSISSVERCKWARRRTARKPAAFLTVGSAWISRASLRQQAGRSAAVIQGSPLHDAAPNANEAEIIAI